MACISLLTPLFEAYIVRKDVLHKLGGAVSYAYNLFEFMGYLKEASPEQADRIWRTARKTHNGMLSVGLKLHCLDGGPQFIDIIDFLGGAEKVLDINFFKRRNRDAICWVLPPLGNVESAILLLETLENVTCRSIFNNPAVQIQVCSPGRLSEESAAILSIGFCLGSDRLRRFMLNDFDTTFRNVSYHARGRRLALYDANGTFERNYAWWGLENGRLSVQQRLPFKDERTDILAATSKSDLRNINLLATLLLHEERNGYWTELGSRLRWEIYELLDRHDLLDLLELPWISTIVGRTPDGFNCEAFDMVYEEALNRLMSKAFSDAKEIREKPLLTMLRTNTPNILVEMVDLLSYMRAEMAKQVRKVPSQFV